MAIREELTLGLQGWKRGIDEARSDVRRLNRDIKQETRAGFADRAGYSDKGADGMITSTARAIGPAVVAMAAFRTGIEAVSVAMERQRSEMALGAVSTEDVGDQLDRLRELGESPGLGFDQVVAGSTRLQAVGFSAERAEKAILEMGNALALVGGGKEQLDGVLLALTQIVAKGTVSAEEINQIAERLPQIRGLMQEAFGTADTEAIQKLGIGVDEFVDGIVNAASELERATLTSSEAMSNLQDDWRDFMQSIGDMIEPAMQPVLQGLSALLEKSSSVVQTIAAVHSVAAATLFGTDGSDGAARLGGGNFDEATEALEQKNRALIEDKPGKKPSEIAAEEKAAADQQEQLEMFAREEAYAERDAARRREAEAERRAAEKEKAAREAASAQEDYEENRFSRMDPEAQMAMLRERIAQSLGVEIAGSTADIEAGAEYLASTGRHGEAASVLSNLSEMEAIAGRMTGGPGEITGGAQGSFATLMDQIFGRGTAEQQLDEIRATRTAAQDQKILLDKILTKMDEPPERDIWSDSV